MCHNLCISVLCITWVGIYDTIVPVVDTTEFLYYGYDYYLQHGFLRGLHKALSYRLQVALRSTRQLFIAARNI